MRRGGAKLIHVGRLYIALGVLAGSLFSEYINEKYLHYIAGIGFVLIGAFTLCNA
jgi:putative Ca2+/H+ antiporter (TMEM165/GDT1 family)